MAMVSTILGVLAALLTLTLLPFYAYLGLVALAALFGRRRTIAANEPMPRFAIVIPAHNEASGIASTVASCLASDYEEDRFRVHVIADNCDDATATIARQAGADVFERRTTDRKTKGYALETFFEAQPGPWADGNADAAVIVDADTVIDAELLRAFATIMAAGDDWAQAYYTVRNPDASWRTRLMTLAFSLVNGVLPLGRDRLGLGVGLKGNGMLFTRRGLNRFPWKAYGLVEDAEFSLMLATAGEHVRFLPEARVYGEMVSRGKDAVSQRRRWESGRRELRRRFTGKLLETRQLGLLAKMFDLTDLYLPPLVTLVVALGIALSLTVAAHVITASPPAPFLIGVAVAQLLMGLALLLYLITPFSALKLPLHYLLDLVYLPYYSLWKLLAVAHLTPQGWERTGREADGAK